MTTNVYPDGPVSLPFIGNKLQLGKDPHQKLREMSKKYGKIVSVKFGDKEAVVLNSMELLREAMVQKGQDFNGRPPLRLYEELASKSNKGLRLAEEPYWRVSRKIADLALKIVGHEKWEKIIEDEAKTLIATLKDVEERRFDPAPDIDFAVTNVMCTALFSTRYKRDDKEFLMLYQNQRVINENIWKNSPQDYFSFIKHLPDSDKTTDFRLAVAARDAFFHRKLMEHKSTFQHDRIRDVTDALIKARMEMQAEIPDINISDEYLELLIWDLFDGACATTSAVLKWTLVYMLNFPSVQEKVHQELQDVLGDDPVSIADRVRLPYLQASILETLRLSPPLPLTVPHRTTLSTKIGQFTIPKDTIIVSNLWAMQRDPDVFLEAEVFTPDRFIDPDTNHLFPLSSMNFQPFGAGPRRCPGESFAMMQLFLFSAFLLHQYNVELPSGAAMPATTGELQKVLQPEPFQVLLHSR
uniref:Steroid 17-alpha-hydroxylase/17,20 lyase-like n=1 Tax=Saccoglossus kowalevskii TaxID=10224 RepID=A0ABM0GYI3_SACKO|nr:PREDICTED: steroid 17-alpha-hydroxylase/17,20 lyase-like [Saccoglossus kowalevskii]